MCVVTGRMWCIFPTLDSSGLALSILLASRLHGSEFCMTLRSRSRNLSNKIDFILSYTQIGSIAELPAGKTAPPVILWRAFKMSTDCLNFQYWWGVCFVYVWERFFVCLEFEVCCLCYVDRRTNTQSQHTVNGGCKVECVMFYLGKKINHIFIDGVCKLDDQDRSKFWEVFFFRLQKNSWAYGKCDLLTVHFLKSRAMIHKSTYWIYRSVSMYVVNGWPLTRLPDKSELSTFVEHDSI